MAEAAKTPSPGAAAAAAAVDAGAGGPRTIQSGEWVVLHMGDGRHFFAQAAAKGYVRTCGWMGVYIYSVVGMHAGFLWVKMDGLLG